MRDTWLARSKQHWKLRVADVVLIGGTALGMLLFFRATWPESFYGGLLTIVATPIAVAMASSVRCSVCGYRVVLNAPSRGWSSYTSALKACPECGDDGTGRPVDPAGLPAWFQAAREVAVRERTDAKLRRKRIAVRIAFAIVVIGFGIGVSLCDLR